MLLGKVRIALLVVLVILLAILVNKWQQAYDVTAAPPAVPTASSSGQAPILNSSNATPSALTPAATSAASAVTKTITIHTDVLNATIDLNGGGMTAAQLLQYPKSLHSKEPVTLFSSDSARYYVAQSGLSSEQLPKTPLQFSAAKTHYEMAPGQQQLHVNLTWSNGRGLEIVKTYTFTRGSYAIAVDDHIHNNTDSAWQGRFYGQLLRQPFTQEEHGFLSSYAIFTGAALSTPSDHYQKFTFKELSQQNIQQTAQGGWIAMVQHYFISAWIPNQQQQNQYYNQIVDNGTLGVGVANPIITVPAHSEGSTGATLYVGPADTKTLSSVAPNLDLTVDYGWLWFISILIFHVMSWIYTIVGNWGWSIVLVTILIKIAFSPLSAKSYRSMAKMRLLQPKIAALKERFGDDRQQMGRATMELYKSEKVNPLSGCLPMIVQIPVFIALYWMLMESVELRQAPFIFWIHDLSQKDPYFVLPILMGISMFVQQRLNPAPPDPTQAKIMMFMPVIFTVMFLSFPSGLVLYWLVNNLVSILQQWYIMRQVARKPKTKAVVK